MRQGSPGGLGFDPNELGYAENWGGGQVEDLFPELEPEQEGSEHVQAFQPGPLDPIDPDGQQEHDEEALLAALDEALDEIETEQRVEYARELATPEKDVSEIYWLQPDTAYRAMIDQSMGHRYRDLPRPRPVKRINSQIINVGLYGLLADNLHQSRSKLAQRRSKLCLVDS